MTGDDLSQGCLWHAPHDVHGFAEVISIVSVTSVALPAADQIDARIVAWTIVGLVILVGAIGLTFVAVRAYLRSQDEG